MIFVFGSNLAGRHGMGAAKYARAHFGAIYGKGEGMQGGSYAIPTKNAKLAVLPLASIRGHVRTFLDFARAKPDLLFQVTPIGCGLAGYTRAEIAPLFEGAPPNCVFLDEAGKDWRE